MDTLSWTQLNPTVKRIETKKKFFNHYLHKAVIYAPGCRIINDNKVLIQGVSASLQRRLEILEYHRGHSSYRHEQIRSLINNARVDQIEYWIDIKNNFKSIIKVRVEEPHLSIYCNDENQLYSIVNKNYPQRIIEIHTPANDKSIEILNRGEIVVKKEPEFPYKISIRENKIRDIETKRNLLDYLYNLGDDEVCLTKSLVKHLGSSSIWFPGGYFYAKDEKVITFINLIAPGCIAGIYKLSAADL